MDIARFETLAEAHGGVIARWPKAEQDRAYALLAEAPEAGQALLNDALALDDMLEVLRPPVASAQLRDRILALAPHDAARQPLRRVWRWLAGAGVGAALAGACAAGVAVGVGVTGVRAPHADETALAAAATDDDWISLSDTEVRS